jgi:hypothetical protein
MLKNQGIGPQGKDRAFSSQSGYVGQKDDMKTTLLNLLSEMKRKADSRRSSPDIHK